MMNSTPVTTAAVVNLPTLSAPPEACIPRKQPTEATKKPNIILFPMPENTCA